MAIYKLIANGSFGPKEIEVMSAAYESALVNLGIANRDDPITELIAKAIVGRSQDQRCIKMACG